MVPPVIGEAIPLATPQLPVAGTMALRAEIGQATTSEVGVTTLMATTPTLTAQVLATPIPLEVQNTASDIQESFVEGETLTLG